MEHKQNIFHTDYPRGTNILLQAEAHHLPDWSPHGQIGQDIRLHGSDIIFSSVGWNSAVWYYQFPPNIQNIHPITLQWENYTFREHIEHNTKSPIFWRQHLSMYYLERKYLYLDSNLIEAGSQGSKSQKLNIGPVYGLALNRWKAITWTNGDQDAHVNCLLIHGTFFM